MAENGSITFMNNYHTSDDLEYSTLLADWDEHLGTQVSSDSYEIKQTGKGLEFDTKDVKFTTDELKDMMSDSTLGDPESMLSNRFNKFSRYGYLDPSGELITGTREYLFFSKPDLNLVSPTNPGSISEPLSSIPFFNEAFSRYKLSYYSLQQYYGGKQTLTADGLTLDLQNKYINLLSNMVTSSLDLSDITAAEVTNNQNLYQTNTSYREGSLVSDLQYDFSLEFKDTKYLDVYMLFKIYDEYFRYKYMVELPPVRYDYITNRIYPEALSIWKIITDDTGRIMYWAKATGCTPMSVPRGSVSNIEGNIKFTINWKAQFVKDMDPVNLTELNYLTAKSMGVGYEKLNNNTFNTSNSRFMSILDKQTWAGYPLVISGEGVTTRTGQNVVNNSKSKSNAGFHRLVWINKV